MKVRWLVYRSQAPTKTRILWNLGGTAAQPSLRASTRTWQRCVRNRAVAHKATHGGIPIGNIYAERALIYVSRLRTRARRGPPTHDADQTAEDECLPRHRQRYLSCPLRSRCWAWSSVPWAGRSLRANASSTSWAAWRWAWSAPWAADSSATSSCSPTASTCWTRRTAFPSRSAWRWSCSFSTSPWCVTPTRWSGSISSAWHLCRRGRGQGNRQRTVAGSGAAHGRAHGQWRRAFARHRPR